MRRPKLIDFATCTQDDVIEFARMIYAAYNDSADSLEEMAQHVVQELFGEFQDDQGEPAFALLRMFRVSRYAELPDDLKPDITDNGGHWLTLMSTVGLEAAWCDRHTSIHHQLQNMNQPLTPLIQAVFEQIGMKTDGSGVGIGVFSSADRSTGPGFFYVADALDSPHIVDIEEFVKPYGVKSVVAVGSPFRSGAAGLLVGFSRVPLSPEQACYFANMGVYIFTLLAQHDEKRIWD